MCTARLNIRRFGTCGMLPGSIYPIRTAESRPQRFERSKRPAMHAKQLFIGDGRRAAGLDCGSKGLPLRLWPLSCLRRRALDLPLSICNQLKRAIIIYNRNPATAERLHALLGKALSR